jgi:uncharacterized protein YbjT (DUF2867 family)
MRILLAGGSGLVGGCLRNLARRAGHDLVLVGRRSVDATCEEVLTNFHTPLALPRADAAICTLGTTIATAGSREAFYAVDHDAVLCFARSAREAGVDRFAVVTAVGADPRARVFYSRVKGETERDLADLGFCRLDIAQPGLLIGPREERRPVERFLQTVDPVARRFLLGPMDCYAGIDAETVARALLVLCDEREDGVFRHRNRELTRAVDAAPE